MELSGRHYKERKGGVTGGKTRGKRERERKGARVESERKFRRETEKRERWRNGGIK